MSDCYAVLLEATSIQNYIFSSNKLKENLGASYLVEEIYSKYLANALCSITGRKFDEELEDLNTWKDSESESPDCSKSVEIGYIGGGNSLLFFQDKELAQKFIEEWTKIILIHAPGLTTAVACSTFPKDSHKFKEGLKLLFGELKRNKFRYSPITALSRHGITAEDSSGASAEIYSNQLGEYVSAGINAKLEANSLSKDEIEKKYQSVLDNQYCFSDELDKLGSISGENSHIAIVHIDGNDMSDRFKKTKTLKEIRQLSKTVDSATEEAFKAVLETAVKQYDNIMQSLGFDQKSDKPELHYPKEDDKYILPIRSIILGGDDVTFVCDGRLGIYFAKIFIEAFERGEASDGKKLSACAGIAIIQTKYPFYRGVALAHELCTNAKKKRKSERSQDSFLDFHVSLGGITEKLNKIRESHFKVPQGNLLYRPFKILPKESTDEYSLDMFLSKVYQLQYKGGSESLPNSKISELREVLTFTEETTRKFVQELEYRGRELPEIEGRHYREKLFDNGITPYFDMVEILRFYPEFALREIGEK